MPKIVVVTDASLKSNSNGQIEVNLSTAGMNLLYVTGGGELGVNANANFSKNYYPINTISGSNDSVIGKLSCSSAVSRLVNIGDPDGDIFNTGATGSAYNEGVNTYLLMNDIIGGGLDINWWTKEEYQKTTNMGVTPSA